MNLAHLLKLPRISLSPRARAGVRGKGTSANPVVTKHAVGPSISC
jgi:hypothetical protein